MKNIVISVVRSHVLPTKYFIQRATDNYPETYYETWNGTNWGSGPEDLSLMSYNEAIAIANLLKIAN